MACGNWLERRLRMLDLPSACRELITNKQKVITSHASSAYKHALREVLEAQGIASQIKVAHPKPPYV